MIAKKLSSFFILLDLFRNQKAGNSVLKNIINRSSRVADIVGCIERYSYYFFIWNTPRYIFHFMKNTRGERRKLYSYAISLLLFIVANTAIAQTALPDKQYNIGLLIVATGKYINFVPPLIDSARKHFCTNHHVTYFIFTDGQAPQADDVVCLFQKRLGWPYDTMMRLAIYAGHKDMLQQMDYLYACDADMLFVDTVGAEILGDRVGTLHPGYVGGKGTPEHRATSTACIKPGANKYYFAGGFNGGTAQEFLRMAQTITDNVKKDLEYGIIAVWHDESHVNKYFHEHQPTVVLSPSYCYWEGQVSPYHQRLVALNKNHADYRS